MRVVPESDDSPEFVSLVDRALDGIIRRYSPSTVVLIKIDNWFGSRWLGFKGKFIGSAGVTQNVVEYPAKDVAIPPFVPERVVSQRQFVSPSNEEIDAGTPIHKHVPSRLALRRRASSEAPGEALIWYSGNSKTNGRGSLMAYLPLDSMYWPWFVDFQEGNPWRITEIRGIKPEDLSLLMAS